MTIMERYLSKNNFLSLCWLSVRVISDRPNLIIEIEQQQKPKINYQKNKEKAMRQRETCSISA